MDSEHSDLLVRIQRLEDLDAIRRTWHDYMISLDSRAWADLADVFTDDAVVEMIGLDFLRSGADGTYSGGGDAIVRDFYNAVTGQRAPTQIPRDRPQRIEPQHRPRRRSGHHQRLLLGDRGGVGLARRDLPAPLPPGPGSLANRPSADQGHLCGQARGQRGLGEAAGHRATGASAGRPMVMRRAS